MSLHPRALLTRPLSAGAHVHSHARAIVRPFLTALPTRPPLAPRSPSSGPSWRRPFSNRSMHLANGGSRGTPQQPSQIAPSGEVRNADIPFRSVHIVDPTTNALSPLTPLKQILSSISLDTHAVRLVSSSPPIVRLVDLADEQKKAREHDARLRLNRKTAVEDKEVQVSWLSAPGDLAHKIASARAIVERGDRVHVICASRSGTAAGDVGEKKRQEVFAMFDAALEEVGKKWKDDEKREQTGMWIMYWQPKESIRASAKQKVFDEEVEKRRAKDEKKEARKKKEEERARKARERSAATAGVVTGSSGLK